ncbi:MAG: hypothetical protein ACYCSO_00400 [Cuniculiplasma sp.]
MNRYLLAYGPQSDTAFIRTEHKKIPGTVEINGLTMVDLGKGNDLVEAEKLNLSRTDVGVTPLITKRLGNLPIMIKSFSTALPILLKASKKFTYSRTQR